MNRDTFGAGGFSWCCCSVWTTALVALGLGIAAFVLALVLYNKNASSISECCDALTFAGPQSGQSYALCETATGAAGVVNGSDYTTDECNGFFIVMTRVVTPSDIGVATGIEVCAEFGPVDDPAPGFTAAVYADDGFGVPGALIANASTGTLAPNALNCLPIQAPIAESQYLWLAFMTEGSTCDVNNNLKYTAHSAPRSIQSADFAYPTWPAEIAPGYDYVYYVYAMQLRYNATCASAAA